MRFIPRVSLLLQPVLLLATFFLTNQPLRLAAIDFQPQERIVLLGNNFAERMQHYGYFEALLQSRHPTHRLTLRNLGWSGDEVGLMPRPLNFEGGAGDLYANDTNVGYNVPRSTDVDFKMLKAHLRAQQADTILLCFGANESFRGPEGVTSFSEDYQRLLDELGKESFNGESTPRLILVTPIPQENLGPPFEIPIRRNQSLQRYANAVVKIAERNNAPCADLFEPVLKLMEPPSSGPYTIDSLQLNSTGQRAVAEILIQSLGLPHPWSEDLEPVRNLITEKNKQFFFRWRPINAEYVFGRRKEPFGVLTFPPEMKQWEQNVANLDGEIHQLVKKLRSPE